MGSRNGSVVLNAGVPSRGERLRFSTALLCSLLVLPLIVGGRETGSHAVASAAEHEEARPPVVPFPEPAYRDLDLESDQLIRELIRDHFADLSAVVLARRRLVMRFGLLSVPALAAQDGSSVTQTWNALLTLGALRDTYGSAPELIPALDAMARLLSSDSNEIHLRAFAALAMGCYRYFQGQTSGLLRGSASSVPGPREQAERARSLIEAGTRLLGARLGDDNEVVRTACLVALAKRGGPEALELVRGSVGQGVGMGPRLSRLLALGLLQTPDPGPLLEAIADEDRRLRAAAALSIAVALLGETPPAWTEGTDENRRRLLGALTGPSIMLDKEDGAAATFARGVCAERWQRPEEWRALWDRALLASTAERVAEAAAQALCFCSEPWLMEEARKVLRRGLAVKRPVLALLLLRAGSDGSRESFELCATWLRSKAIRPSPDDRFDPRWYAIAGLLRALRDGRFKAQAMRVEVVETLEKCSARILSRKAPPRAELDRILGEYAERLKGPRLHLLPDSEVNAYDEACACPHGLLGDEIEDVGLWRVARLIDECFYLDSLAETSTTDLTRYQPQRHLKRYLDQYPYFSRLDLLDNRGQRVPEGLDGSGGEVFDR